MKITAKLAYNQVKINRSRTMWTLIGIILSTALITAVCSFVASGNSLVVDLLGEGYGDHGGTLTTLLFIPISILTGIIVSMAVVVISNAFRVSAGERTIQFGILKSVGATKRQIISTVMYESIFLSAIAIPIGIVVGLILAFTGVGIANHFLGEINSLTQIMIREFYLVIDFVIAWQALVAAALISFFTVLFSAWLPARKAAKISAIDSIRGMGEVTIEIKQIHTSPLTQKLFGFEGTLAAKNMKRNKRNFRASLVSLTIGIILFINLSALGKQASLLEDMIFPDIDASVMVDYTSSRNFVVNETTGREEAIIVAPINDKVADAITQKFYEYEDTNIFSTGFDMDTYTAIVPRNVISPMMSNAIENQYPVENSSYDFSVELITLDPKHYDLFCKQAGVSSGSNILLNHYSYNDNGNLIDIKPFLFDDGTIQLTQADGSVYEMPVHGILTGEDIPNELLGVNTGIVRIVIPKGDMRGYMWYADPTDLEGFMKYANVIMGEVFPQGQDSSYMEAGFSTRVYKTQDYMKVMNIAIVLMMVFVYSFVALLMLIGLTSVVSTMSTNVRMRSREFAVLQSVGMTRRGLKRMLNLESIMCSAKSLVIGLPIAIALTYLINLPIRSKFPIPYQLPWLASAWCIALTFGITWGTIHHSASQLRNKNIVETIRSESGM